MGDRHHYDAQGNYRGMTTDAPSGLGALIVAGVIIYAAAWVLDGVINYQYLTAPYNYVAAFYYFSIIVPIKFVGDLYFFVAYSKVLPWPNINFILGLASVVFYIVSVFYVLIVLCGVLSRIIKAPAAIIVLLFFISPLIFCVLWFVGGVTLEWLFTSETSA